MSKLINQINKMQCCLDDGKTFHEALKIVSDNIKIEPVVWMTDFEFGYEWLSKNKHAYVSLEGDGLVRYTMLKGENFKSGLENNCPTTRVPQDLLEYLTEGVK